MQLHYISSIHLSTLYIPRKQHNYIPELLLMLRAITSRSHILSQRLAVNSRDRKKKDRNIRLILWPSCSNNTAFSTNDDKRIHITLTSSSILIHTNTHYQECSHPDGSSIDIFFFWINGSFKS